MRKVELKLKHDARFQSLTGNFQNFHMPGTEPLAGVPYPLGGALGAPSEVGPICRCLERPCQRVAQKPCFHRTTPALKTLSAGPSKLLALNHVILSQHRIGFNLSRPCLTVMLNWKRYDPTWLVDLAAKSRPELEWLPEALSRCTQAAQESDAYIHFIDPLNANEPKSEWQFKENVILEHPEHGELVLDILSGNRIGGVEFLRRLPG